MHPYFLGWHSKLDSAGSLASRLAGRIIQARLRYWVQLQLEEDRDDFLVEKSKCAMLQFFQRNALPAVPVRDSGSKRASRDATV